MPHPESHPVSGRLPGRLQSMALAMATLGLLSACGGGGGGGNVSDPAPTGLSGSVAVGVPLTQGKVRVIDATGAVVASDIVVAADGSFNVPALSGTAPFRIEACGYAGPDYTCVYSLAQGAGVANVTPLTSATVLLASGQTPEALMSGQSSLGAAAVEAAQQQLRTGLADVLNGNVGSDFDFITGALAGGSRSGYDRVLDSVGVATGVDGQPFVQITPRLGSGNLYLQQGSSSGTVTVDQAAAALPLDGLGALFARMSAALASASACASADTGLASQLASTARMNMDGQSLVGPAQVGAGLCQMFDSTGQWGATLLNPTLGRCDLSGAAPVCRVGFALQAPSGAVQNVGGGMGVLRDGTTWKFLGSYFPLQFDVSARAQRDRRIDGGTVVDSYVRALAIGVPTAAGLQCARVSQIDSAGQRVGVAVLKRAPGDHVKNLSIWRDPQTGERSLDPASGSLRDADDTWLMLPQGGSGDELVRNFFRGGRQVTIALYSDSACSTAMSLDGSSSFDVDISGVPPVWDALPTLAWPELSGASAQALIDLSLDADASTNLTLAWSFPNGRLGLGEMGFCSVANACGDGGVGRIGSGSVDASGTGATLSLHNGASALGDFRQLSLYGGTGEGLNLQANFTVCRNRPAGQSCW